jgi:hypothetical protein
MLIIFGFRTRVKALARLLLVCSVCGKPAAQTVYRRVRWFTLFFIPVVPVTRQHRMQCALCGSVSSISKEDADRLAAEAARTSAADSSQPAPLDGSHEAIPAE